MSWKDYTQSRIKELKFFLCNTEKNSMRPKRETKGYITFRTVSDKSVLQIYWTIGFLKLVNKSIHNLLLVFR